MNDERLNQTIQELEEQINTQSETETQLTMDIKTLQLQLNNTQHESAEAIQKIQETLDKKNKRIRKQNKRLNN